MCLLDQAVMCPKWFDDVHLAGFLVPPEDEQAPHRFLEETGYRFTDEIHNPACEEFLAAPPAMQRPLKTATR